MNLEALNRLAKFLALTDDVEATDVGVLVGCSVLANAETISKGYFAGNFPRIFVCGGIGHSTQDLRELVSDQYPNIETADRAESEMFRDILVSVQGVPAYVIQIEARSTNCVGNARETRLELERLGWTAQSLTIVQDPTMQRRTDATFRRVWQDLPEVRFVNRPPFIPTASWQDGVWTIDPPAWSADRFLSLVLGEIPRLRDDEKGYGPRGRDFLVHVDIPDEVESDFEGLVRESGAIAATRTLS
jgi:uncharacterized SAM-binding protein YcdF (DUF218 family)